MYSKTFLKFITQIIIIKFTYNAHSDWLKKVLYEIIKHGDKVCIEK